MRAEALTTLAKESGVSLNANCILSALLRTSFAEQIEYLSTSGSGEVKTYFVLTEAGLQFGINKPTLHEFKTDPRFYRSRFPTLLRTVSDQLNAEVQELEARHSAPPAREAKP